MDKIARIRQEIERHRQAIRVLNEHTAPEQMSKTCAIFQYSDSILSALNSFLDTLSEEPDKSLEEAAEEYYQKEVEETKCHHASALTYAQGYEDALLRVKKAFIAGAKEHQFRDTTKKIDKSLEEEYMDYVVNDPVYTKLVNRIAGLGIARHFAEWGAEHLKK